MVEHEFGMPVEFGMVLALNLIRTSPPLALTVELQYEGAPLAQDQRSVEYALLKPTIRSIVVFSLTVLTAPVRLLVHAPASLRPIQIETRFGMA